MNKTVSGFKKYKDVIIIFLISVLFSFGFFYSINPAFYFYGDDPACFYVIGKAVLNGKMPYIDFVDNKGPITYLLFAVSSLMGEFPNGIFIICFVLSFISLLSIMNVCKKLNIKYRYLTVLLFLAFYACITKGGFTEDLAVPFIVLSFDLLIGFYKKPNKYLGFEFGILFSLCAMTRLNNAVPIGVIALCIGIKFIVDKEFKYFAKYVGSAALSSAICAAPIVIWLNRKGALIECLNQSFFNNFKYKAASTAVPKDVVFLYSKFGSFLFCSVIIGALICVYTAYHNKEKRFLSITFCASLLTTFASYYVVTQLYNHYLICLLVPSFFCTVILLFAESTKTKLPDNLLKIALALSVCFSYILNGGIGFGSYLSGAGRIKYLVTNPSSAFEDSIIEQSVKRITDNIPEDERDSVFSIEMSPCVYAFSRITPCKRLFVCSNLFVDISDEFADEFKGYFENEPPEWLMTGIALEDIDICGLKDKLTSMYSLKDSESLSIDGYEMLYLYELN